MTIAIICSSLLAALVFLLGANVTRNRVITGKAGGDQQPRDPASRLLIAIRATATRPSTSRSSWLVPAGRLPQPGMGSHPVDHHRNSTPAPARVRLLSAVSLAARGKSREVGALGTYLTGVALAVAAVASL